VSEQYVDSTMLGATNKKKKLTIELNVTSKHKSYRLQHESVHAICPGLTLTSAE